MAETKTPITFHVFRKDGSRNPDIKLYFLEQMDVTAIEAIESKIKLPDGSEWTLVLEEKVKDALKEKDTVRCIVSFQARVRGNYAVARLYDATYSSKSTRTKAHG